MPMDSYEKAQLDHVDDDGDLVFRAGGIRFAVTLDDALERALLEARQIRSEAGMTASPNMVQTLPISRIQGLIRAGMEPKDVAEKYGLSEVLVRRFSAAVQTEKQYAIEQFLSVPAPKESQVHSVRDLIARTLAAARIGMESVSWSATRRSREPWRITAAFRTARNRVRAEWTWNMHDNTVECRNVAAQILFGEVGSPRGGEGHDDGRGAANGMEPDSPIAQSDATDTTARDEGVEAAPADSGVQGQPLSRRIEQGNVAWQEQAAYAPHRQDGQLSAAGSAQAPGVDAGTGANTGVPANATSVQAGGFGAQGTVPVNALSSLPLPDRTKTQVMDAIVPQPHLDVDEGGNNVTSPEREPEEPEEPKGRKRSAKGKAKGRSGRRSKRSAVPSWDEILFGE